MLMDARKERIGDHAAASALPWAVTAPRPRPRRPADPAGMAAAGRLDRRLPRTVRLRPPRRPDRPRTRHEQPGPARRLARGPRHPRPRRRARRPRHARRAAAAPARHLPHRNRLGTPMGRRRAPPGPRRAPATPASPRLRAAAEAAAARPADEHQEAARPAGPGRQLPGHARHLPRTRDRVRRRHGRPRPTGNKPPATSGIWPWPPTPNCAAATPNSPGHRCVPLNPSPSYEDEHGVPAAGESSDEAAQRITDLAAQHREFSAKLAERQSLMTPAEDPDFEDLGPAFPAWTEPDRDAILQPPRPQIQPSERILELTAGREPDFEATD